MKATPILTCPKEEDELLTPQRKLILLTFYQEIPTAFFSERARKQFKTELNTIFRPTWNNPFQYGIFGGRGKNLKKLLQVENRKERQSLVFYYLLKQITRSHGYGSGEVQFLIDHYFMNIGRSQVLNGEKRVYDASLKILEKIASKYRGMYDHIEFWWKKPKYGNAPDVYGKKLSLAARVKWFEYYGNKWMTHRVKSSVAWLSFLWAVAGAVFFNQRFIDMMGRPRYNQFHTRDSL